ncbi:hypothetical protein V497_01703 [Pseudogymnoascus sp. VKM F-4516 (FW-969)]|nr:hypothetical protein V497_01703 [Pseudogymnoascus sp. VKM F-4516 (FW-969)]
MQRLILRHTPRTLPITHRRRRHPRTVTPQRQRLKVNAIRRQAPSNARASRRPRLRDDRAGWWRRLAAACWMDYRYGGERAAGTAALGLVDGGHGGWAAAGLCCRDEFDGAGEDRAGCVRVAGGGGGAGYCEAWSWGAHGGECYGWHWASDCGWGCGDWGFATWCLLGSGGIEEETVEGMY